MDILRDAAERGIRYREEIGTRRVGPTAEDVAAVSAFDEALTDDGCDAAATLAMLDGDSDVYFGFGYHGNGVNTATWAGKQLADWLDSR